MTTQAKMAQPAAPKEVGLPESAPVWLRMGDEDLARYGGPEWVVFDVAWLFNCPATVLEAYEDVMRLSLFVILGEFGQYSARSARAALFLARHRAGCKDDWERFDPKTMHVKRSLTEPVPDGLHLVKPAGSGRPNGRARAARSADGSKEEQSQPSSTKSPPS